MSGIRFGALVTLLFCAVMAQGAWAADDYLTLSDLDQSTIKNVFLRPTFNGGRPPYTPGATAPADVITPKVEAAAAAKVEAAVPSDASTVTKAAEKEVAQDVAKSVESTLPAQAVGDNYVPQLPIKRDLPPYDFLFDNF